jgi:cathepsin D
MVVSGQTVSLNTQAVIDTGTALIVGPQDDVALFYNQFCPQCHDDTAYSAGFVLPCDSIDPNMTLSISFDGIREWPIAPADFFRPIPGNATWCWGPITYGAVDIPCWIIGDTFLKNVYSVFRFEPPSVGFAKLSP